MTEKNERQETVIIDGIDSVDIYGVNNRLLDRLKNYFPNVRILARGSEIKLNGNPGEVGLLKERLETIMEAVSKGHTLSDSEMDRLLDYKSYPSEVQEQKSMKNDEAYNIVYGNEGRIVRAKTKNQRRLVDEYYKNDLIFALGPAGRS